VRNNRTANKQLVGKDVQRDNYGYFDALHQNWPVKTVKPQKTLLAQAATGNNEVCM